MMFDIHDHDRIRGQFTLEQKIGDRRRRRESRAFHVHDLLALWREDNHCFAGLPNL
jgi:hypothetical protein